MTVNLAPALLILAASTTLEAAHAIVGGGRSDAIGADIRRGIHDYKPIIALMYDGPFRGFKQKSQ